MCVWFFFLSEPESVELAVMTSNRGYIVAAEYLLVEKEPELICTSCTGIIRDPVQSLCGHRYCRGCLEEIIRLVPLHV